MESVAIANVEKLRVRKEKVPSKALEMTANKYRRLANSACYFVGVDY